MSVWSVRVDADTGVPAETLADELMRALTAYSPSVGSAHLAGQDLPARVTVQISVEETTVRRAIDVAAREVAAAVRATGAHCVLARIDALPQDELEIELNTVPPELMGVREIAEYLDVTRQRADQITKRPDFPGPIARLAAGSIWAGSAVRRWNASWERREGRPRASSA